MIISSFVLVVVFLVDFATAGRFARGGGGGGGGGFVRRFFGRDGDKSSGSSTNILTESKGNRSTLLATHFAASPFKGLFVL
jgi:hypothetical protein